MNNKYKMFKNFLHNELEISKDDIKEWIKEAIQEEVKNVIAQGCNIDKEVQNAAISIITAGYKWPNTLTSDVAKHLSEKIEIKIKAGE